MLRHKKNSLFVVFHFRVLFNGISCHNKQKELVLNTKILLISLLLAPLMTFAASVEEFLGHKYEVHSVSFSNDGSLLASGSGDHTAIVWDVETKEKVFVINEHKRTIYSVAFSKLQKNLLATSSSDGHLVLWNVKSKKMIKTLIPGETTSNGIMSLEFSPTENLLAVAYMGGQLVLWNTKTFKVERSAHPHPQGFAMSVRFSPDGTKIATVGGLDTSIALLNSKDLTSRRTFNYSSRFGYIGALWDVSFSPDGDTIATVNSGGVLSLWNEKQGYPVKEIMVNEYLALSVAYSLDGNKIYISGDAFNSETGNFVKTIDAKTGDIDKEFDVHKNRIRNIALSPDGKLLATASWDETVKIIKIK